MDILELRERIQALPLLEKEMSTLQKDLHDANSEAASLAQKYEQRRSGVERLKKESLSSFILGLTGRYDAKLEREQQEETTAKLDYDRAVARLDGLADERDSLKSRIEILRGEKEKYLSELDDRRSALRVATDCNADRYTALEEQRKEIVAQKAEIGEALRAALSAKSTALDIQEELKSAKRWATYDVFSRGGVISHIAKYSRINKAERNFSLLSSQLSNLRKELGDVKGMNASGLSEVPSMQRAVDFWFDNIFTDLSVRGKIRDNAEEISRLLSILNTAECSLNARLSECETELASNCDAEEELLTSL